MSGDDTESENLNSGIGPEVFLCAFAVMLFITLAAFIPEPAPPILVHADGTPLTAIELIEREESLAEEKRLDEIVRLDRIEAEAAERERELLNRQNACCRSLGAYGWSDNTKKGSKTQYVRGYTRSNGTRVKGYYRSPPQR